MDAISKEVLDARLETIETRMDGRIATIEVKIDGKFAGVDGQFSGVDAKFAGVDAKFAGVDAKFAGGDAKFAELRTEMQKGFADMTKWILGTVIGVAAVTITIMTFVLNNAVPKATPTAPAQPAPIVVYAQPAPVAPQAKP
jgi:hypothetical protein